MGTIITEELLNEIAAKYCKEKTPLSKLAKEYGVSKTTLVRYFKGEGSIKLDPTIQEKVDLVKQTNWIEGKSTSGNLGNTILTDNEVIALANLMVEQGLTLEQLVNEGTPIKSTLYGLFTRERLGDELYQKILNQYEINKKNAFNQYNGGRRPR